MDEWFAFFLNTYIVSIYTRGRDERGTLRCFAISQQATIESDGRLVYHEGHAHSKIAHNRQRHAWNTYEGEIVDFSLPPNSYSDHQSEKEYTVEQVKAGLRSVGQWDWLGDSKEPRVG
jgi:hypothetical protein